MKHGPDDKGPEVLDQGPNGRRDHPGAAPGGPGPDGLPAALQEEGAGGEEAALRRLLHSAVDGIEPRTGTLDRLRRAVPARRARKRQAAVGMAAAALFIGTAIPALVHVTDSGPADPNTAMAGQSSQAQGGTGQGEDKGDGAGGRKGGAGTGVQPGKETGKPGGQDRPGGGSSGTAAGASPSATLAAGVPACTPAQLGSATGSAAAPDAAGVVYGTFHVVNISAAACTVAGAGTVTPAAAGAADPAKISAVRHVAGDAATGLPDPAEEISGLVLQPGGAYEEKFAFVPSATCPTTGGGDTTTTGGADTGGPSPDPSPTETAGAPAESGGTTEGTAPQLMSADGVADGSVQVTHTASGGSPSVTATVPGQCAGTVYYTGVLAGE